jgi:DNA-binding response OmpR family regulator
VAARRILIIEDEMMIAMMVEDFLKELGWDVVGWAGGEERALQMARDTDIDAALLDVNLGGQDTFAVADILSKRRIPFVFATGYGADGVADRFRGVPTLTKPFQRDELELALRRATEVRTAGGGPLAEPGSQASPGKSSLSGG